MAGLYCSLGENSIAGLHCIAIESAVGWIELYCNRFKCIAEKVTIKLGLVTSRAEPSFEHFKLGLLIYERARAQAELLNELKIRPKLGLI